MRDESAWALRAALWVNMVLWLVAVGASTGPSSRVDQPTKYVLWTGLAFSAMAQHQAYATRMGKRSFKLWPTRQSASVDSK